MATATTRRKSSSRGPDSTVRRTINKVLAKMRGPASADTSVKTVGGDVTGLTIYGDRPLRFQRLTVPDPEMPTISDPGALESAFKIRVAHLARVRSDARVLVERRYAGRGYQIPVVKQDPNLMTFLAYDEGRIVGTVSVRLDTDSRPLSAHDLYPEEVEKLRHDGWKICEFTQLAVDTEIANKPVLATLFHTAYLYAAVVRGYTFAVIEVNPRHVSFYAKALRFLPLGPTRTNMRVNAPAVLLGVPFAAISEGVETHAGKPANPETKGSLFRFGFRSHEQDGVLNRLRKLVE